MIFTAVLVLAIILTGSVFATDTDLMAFEKLLPMLDEYMEGKYDWKFSQLEEQVEQLQHENQVLEARVFQLETNNDMPFKRPKNIVKNYMAHRGTMEKKIQRRSLEDESGYIRNITSTKCFSLNLLNDF